MTHLPQLVPLRVGQHRTKADTLFYITIPQWRPRALVGVGCANFGVGHGMAPFIQRERWLRRQRERWLRRKLIGASAPSGPPDPCCRSRSRRNAVNSRQNRDHGKGAQ
jgi:hypothetical protein